MDINFLNGIYYVKTESLLKEDDFNSLKRLGRTLFFKYLKTKDYGFNSNYETIDKIIEKELLNVKEELDSTTNDLLITDVFYLDNDLTNIKIIYKEVKEGVKASNYSSLSRFNKETLIAFFKFGNLKVFDAKHQELFRLINEIDLSKDLQDYLQSIEKVTYNYYSKVTKSKKLYYPLYEYLENKKALNNLLTFLKFKKRDETIDKFNDALLEENIIGNSVWISLYTKKRLDVYSKLIIYFNERVIEAIDKFFNEGSIDDLTYELDLYLTDIIKTKSYNSDTIAPIIYYLHLKERESLMVREYYYEK